MSGKHLLKTTIKFGIFIILIFLFWYLSRRYFNLEIEQVQELIGRFPLAVSGLIFVLLYVGLTTLVWVGPKDVLRIAAALFFGAYYSTLFVWLGEMGNLTVMFNLSRKLGREFVRERFKLKDEHIDRTQKTSGILGICALRINPFFPFRLLDLCYGLSSVPFKKYFLVSFFVSPLRVFFIQAILAGGGMAIFRKPNALFEYFQNNQMVFLWSLGYLGLVVLVSLAALVQKLMRKG